MISNEEMYSKYGLHPWVLKKFLSTIDHFEPEKLDHDSRSIFSFEDKEGNIKNLSLKDLYIFEGNLVFELKEKG